MRSISLFILTAMFAVAALGQNPVRVEIPTIPVDPKDVASIDSIIKAFYEAISGPAGQPRQWVATKRCIFPASNSFR